jgi:hypothetical protein
MDSRITKAVDIAWALRGRGLQTGRQFHVTVIFHRSRLVSIGYNNYLKSHPAKRFGPFKPFKSKTPNYHPSLHSEISAICKLGVDDTSAFTFINIRIDNNGNLNNAKPCPNCLAVMNKLGFRNIFYSTLEGIKNIE